MRIGICTVQIPFIKGGAENLTSELFNELIKRGHEVEIINIPFKWYPPKEIVKHAFVWRLLDLTEVNGKKIDLLICTKFPSYIIKHPNKVVWLIHQFREAYDLYNTSNGIQENRDELAEMKKIIIKLDNKTLNESKKLYTISKNVSSRLKKFNNINGKPLYPPPKNADKFNCGDFGNYVLFPSRIDMLKKRQHLLIQAMQYTKTDVKIIIVGNGSHETELRSMVKDLNFTERVQLYGYASDDELINLYANSLGVVYTPYDEDYGYITIEAFLSKKPVVTTIDSGGPLEFVEDSVNGYISNPDPKEIAAKIDYLYLNRDAARKMGEAGFEKIKGMNLTWDNVIKKLLG